MDIKPENILISESGSFKIGDFGSAVKLDQNIGKDDIENHFNDEGDCRYVALELLRDGQLSPKVDMFSFGLTLLEISTKLEIPSHGEPWHILRSGHIPSHFIEMISPPLLEIILQLIDKDPKRRPSARDLLSYDYFQTSQKRLSQPIYINTTESDEFNSSSSSLPNEHSFFLSSYKSREKKRRKSEDSDEDISSFGEIFGKRLSFGDD